MAEGQDIPNFSVAGTGKTLTALEAFKKAGHSTGLVLAPNIALSMWQHESEEWLGCKAQVLRRGADIIDKDADLIIAPYDLAGQSQRLRLYKHFAPTKGKTSALILDESDRLRRHTSKRATAVYGTLTDLNGGFGENHDHIWHMTGNPIARFHDDLWPMLHAIAPDILEHYGSLTYDDFVRNFCYTKMRKYHPRMQPKPAIVSSQNEEIIKHILYEDIGAIRRLKAPDLPPLVEQKLYPTLGKIPAEYAKMTERLTEQQLMKALLSSDDETPMQTIWQAVSLAKVKGSVEHIVDRAADSPVLVGVWHNAVGQAYYEALTDAGLEVRRVYGATPDLEREVIRDQFNAGDIDVIVGQMQAMGVSWNLQEASNRVVIAQDHFNPAIIEQFYSRVYRKGQHYPTYLDYLTSTHPLDVSIARLRAARAVSQAKAIG